MSKPRAEARNLWIERFKNYLKTLKKEELELIKKEVLPTSKVNNLEVFNSGIMGSQRLIYKEITNNIPKDVKTIAVPFACGLDLTYYLTKKGYVVYSCDRMECVRILTEVLKDFITDTDLVKASNILCFTTGKSFGWEDYIKIMRLKLFVGDKYRNWFHWQEDAFEWLPRMMAALNVDLVYLGTPTIMENNKKFYQRYVKLEKELGNEISDDWNRDNEMLRFRKLVEICKSKAVKYVYAGHGSGVSKVEEKESILKEYYKYVYTLFKPYDTFNDYVLFASEVPLRIDRRLWYER